EISNRIRRALNRREDARVTAFTNEMRVRDRQGSRTGPALAYAVRPAGTVTRALVRGGVVRLLEGCVAREVEVRRIVERRAAAVAAEVEGDRSRGAVGPRLAAVIFGNRGIVPVVHYAVGDRAVGPARQLDRRFELLEVLRTVTVDDRSADDGHLERLTPVLSYR